MSFSLKLINTLGTVSDMTKSKTKACVKRKKEDQENVNDSDCDEALHGPKSSDLDDKNNQISQLINSINLLRNKVEKQE